MSLPPDDHATSRDDSDPLLLFATEPDLAAPPEPVVEIPREFAPDTAVEPPPEAPPELAALRSRVETAEHSLLESKQEVEALRRQMATLVAVAAEDRQAAVRHQPALLNGIQEAINNPQHAFRPFAVATTRWRPLAAGVAVLLTVAGMAGWRWGGNPAPLAAAPAAVQAANLLPVPPTAPVAEASPLPLHEGSARPRKQLDPAPRTERTRYVGTLSVDAVPAGGEVFLNRKSVGMTPARITGLRAGSHLVWIERDGYRLFTRVVTVPADKVTRVSVALEPLTQGPTRP